MREKTMRVSLLASAMVAMEISSAGCGSGASPGGEADAQANSDAQATSLASSPLAREAAVLDDTEKTDLATSLSGFAFSLWQEVRREPFAAGNYAFSPASLSLALGMAYAGAKSSTASQMETAMHVANPGAAYLRSLNWLDQQLASRAGDALKIAQDRYTRSAIGSAPNPADYRLHVVNACWGDRTLSFEPSYLDTLAADFGSGVHLADFLNQPEAERLAINGWVAQETLDRIQDLLPPTAIASDTRVVLVNAIHLKLPWYEPFQQTSTRPGTFSKSDGSTVSVPFMTNKTSLSYAEDDTVEAVSLPLAGQAVEFIVFLPKPTTTLAQFEDTLSPATMQSLVAGMKSQEITLALPKFTFTTASVPIAKALVALGMIDAFSPTADFTGITRERLHFSDAFHKAMIGVNENGLEAAAATAIGMTIGLVIANKEMTVDRPFFFGIYDRPTATWLFLGHVTDPSN
jgi:serpin B